MRIFLVVVFVLSASILTGCSAVEKGRTGVTLDEAGRIAIAVAWCDGPPVSIRLEQVEPDSASGTRLVELSAVNPPAGDSIVVTIADPGPGWSGGAAVTLVGGDAVYRAASWPDDTSANLGGATFTVDDVEALRSGEVVTGLGETMSLNEFRDSAVRRC